ncbi:hypothetical protein [Hymenobacter coccineus]|uniref:Uncharacterized protein n=1 Tax=Hymenobacter coccineus TaxID=1908235 RepID=A0A1G1TJY4_9BACT|nr:hypothetical protein [Hymenobacter coccineus]OGX91182.1 hypothetical protein BEN49_20680 [Hymenobacter coccineus]
MMTRYFTCYLHRHGATYQRRIQYLAGLGTGLAAAAIFSPWEAWQPLLAAGALVPYCLILPLLAKTRQLALDRPHGQFRYFTTFFGLTQGAWQPLPRVSKVVVKPFTQDEPAVIAPSTLRSGPPRARVVLLSVPASRHAIIAGKFRADQEFEALLFAKVVAMYLGVEGFVFR